MEFKMTLSVLLIFAVMIGFVQSLCIPNYGQHSIYDDITAPDIFEVTMTLHGNDTPIIIAVNRSWSPIGADHFYALVRDGYYQCAAFYEVNSDYIQSGVAAESSMTSKWMDFISDDDVSTKRQTNTQYRVALVPSNGYGTRSTHFMIHLNDNSYLDRKGYYPLGEVVEGFDVLGGVAQQPFALSENDITAYESGGNEWLFTAYDQNNVSLIGTMSEPIFSSSNGNSDNAGSWAFGVIIVLLASAACVYAGLYIYRYIRQPDLYDTMSPDSASSEREIALNNENA